MNFLSHQQSVRSDFRSRSRNDKATRLRSPATKGDRAGRAGRRRLHKSGRCKPIRAGAHKRWSGARNGCARKRLARHTRPVAIAGNRKSGFGLGPGTGRGRLDRGHVWRRRGEGALGWRRLGVLEDGRCHLGKHGRTAQNRGEEGSGGQNKSFADKAASKAVEGRSCAKHSSCLGGDKNNGKEKMTILSCFFEMVELRFFVFRLGWRFSRKFESDPRATADLADDRDGAVMQIGD